MDSSATAREITVELQKWSEGDRSAMNELLPLVYRELHRQASRFLRLEKPGHTLQTSDLINETYLRLAGCADVRWQNRVHFFGIASRLMREILLDHARTKHRQKRGGHNIRVTLEDRLAVSNDQDSVDLIALDEALTKLSEFDPQQTRIVEMKFFAGLNIEEMAEALGISASTVKRDWQMARAWLRNELSNGPSEVR